MNKKLEEKIEKIKQMSIEELCQKFNCKPEEICLGDYIAKNTNDTVCPYKVILGFANFEGSNVISLGDLEIVYGKKLVDKYGEVKSLRLNNVYLGLNIRKSKITNLRKLRKVYGSIELNEYITSMGNMEFLGSNLYLINSNVISLGNLQIIDGILNLEDDVITCKLESLGKLKKVRRLFIYSNCLRDLGDLEEVKEISISQNCSERVRNLIEKSFVSSKLKYVRNASQIIK